MATRNKTRRKTITPCTTKRGWTITAKPMRDFGTTAAAGRRWGRGGGEIRTISYISFTIADVAGNSVVRWLLLFFFPSPLYGRVSWGHGQVPFAEESHRAQYHNNITCPVVVMGFHVPCVTCGSASKKLRSKNISKKTVIRLVCRHTARKTTTGDDTGDTMNVVLWCTRCSSRCRTEREKFVPSACENRVRRYYCCVVTTFWRLSLFRGQRSRRGELTEAESFKNNLFTPPPIHRVG
jgi:hypothetical protein